MSAFEKWNIGLLAGTLVTLFVYTYFTGGLWLTARDTAERQLRAYVTLETGGIAPNEDGTALIVGATLRNTGQTPAYRFSTWQKVRIDRLDADPFADELAKKNRSSFSIIGPDATVDLTLVHPVMPNQIDAIRNGTLKVFVWGGADYEDAFGKAREFRFRDVNGNQQQDGGWSLQPHKTGYTGN